MICLSSVFLMGCGTTHHFLPGRPLAKGETLVTISWHYDFGRVHLIDITPDVNYYVGQKDNISLGFGVKFPAYFSHLSAVKYWKQRSEEYLLSYIHLNQITGVNDNPYLEFGGGYSSKGGKFYHNYMIGMSFGTGIVLPLIRPASPGYNTRGHFFPTLKYSAIGKHWGYSMSYYHKLTEIALDTYYSNAISDNDTVCILRNDEIDSILLADNGEVTYFESELTFYLANGDTVNIFRPFYCGTGLVGGTFFGWMGISPFTRRLNSHYTQYRIGTFGDAYIDLNDIREKYNSGSDIVITEYPEQLRDSLITEISRKSKFWNNISLGVSLRDNQQN